MAYMAGLGRCGMCDRTFSFNLERVPCYPIDTSKPSGISRLSTHGTKAPVCENCHNVINRIRADNGMPPNVVLPGAYEPEDLS